VKESTYFESLQQPEAELHSQASRTPLKPTEPTIPYVLGDLFQGLKQTGSDANQSLSSNFEIGEVWK
jgi:hypothetical protein